MLYIPESPLSGQIITLIKPVGKEIPLRLGEIIEGQVVDIFPYGGLTLKVKGGYLPARTDLNFEKQETLFLKVLGQGSEGGELRFQLLNSKTGSEASQEQAKTSLGIDVEKIENFIKKLSDLIVKYNGSGVEEGKDPGLIPAPRSLDVQKIRGLLEDLLKALPSNIHSLSKELRNQIQQLLQFSLKGSGQDIQANIAQLPNQLPEGLTISYLVQGLRDGQLFFEEGINAEQLKTALENSGVVLEAKLKAFVDANINESRILYKTKINNDIKTILLQLKSILEQKRETLTSPGFLRKLLGGLEKTLGEEMGPFQKAQGVIETLLKEVETYQLLSKISDSFFTFLPVQWDELKRGELVFKRRRQSRQTSYSCGIHLELKRLGPISVFIFMQDRDYYMTFQVEHLELKDMIHSHLEDLKELFGREGLNLKNISLLGRTENFPDPFDRVESEETLVSIRV